MTNYYKIPLNLECCEGQVYSRGGEYKVVESEKSLDYDTELSLFEVQVFCLKANYCTPTKSKCEEVREEILDSFGKDIKQVEIEDLGCSVYNYLLEHRPSYPEKHFKYAEPDLYECDIND